MQRVHAAVIAADESVCGVSVYLVDEEYDRCHVIAQSDVPVLPSNTPETLAASVLIQEHLRCSQTIQCIGSGDIELDCLA